MVLGGLLGAGFWFTSTVVEWGACAGTNPAAQTALINLFHLKICHYHQKGNATTKKSEGEYYLYFAHKEALAEASSVVGSANDMDGRVTREPGWVNTLRSSLMAALTIASTFPRSSCGAGGQLWAVVGDPWGAAFALAVQKAAGGTPKTSGSTDTPFSPWSVRIK